MRRILISLIFLALIGVTIPGVAQQGSYGAISGSVVDTTGALIPGAQIIVTEALTNVKSQTISNGSGRFDFPTLAPGTYNINVTAAGFRGAERTGVQVSVAQAVSISFKLQTGGGEETVTVSADDDQLDKDTAQISHYVTAKEFETFPLPVTSDGEREIQDFVFKALPGATGEGYLGSINGGQVESNEIYIDGISLGTFDTAELVPSADSVGAFNLQTGSMGAQFNGGGTAIQNFSIKSGTNHLHGSAYEYLQNRMFNANTYDATANDVPKGTENLNSFGFTVSGPVMLPKLYNGKDKTFFFFSYEGTRKDYYDLSGQTSMPTPAVLGGDLSAYLNATATGTQNANCSTNPSAPCANGQVAGQDILGRNVIQGQIYDPATTRLLTAGEIDPTTGLVALRTGDVREPFANNQIPTSRFDPVAVNYLKLKFPTNFINQNVVNNLNTYYNNQPQFTQNIYAFKIDQNISVAHKASFYYSTDDRKRVQTQCGVYDRPGTSPIDCWDNQSTPGSIVRLSEYWTISPSLNNHFAAGYNRFTNSYVTPFSSENWISNLGIPDGYGTGFPTVSFSGAAKLGAVNGFGNPDNGGGTHDQSTMFIDTVAWSHGRHQFTFGTEFRFYNENDQNITKAGAFSFANTSTDSGYLNSSVSGNAFASFLLGETSSTSKTIYVASYGFRRREEGTYIQDNWKISPKLTIDLGLRWEVMGGLYEAHGDTSAFSPTTPNSAADNLPGALVFASAQHKKGFENRDWGLILPRVGFNYQMSPRMVLKAGYGINTQSPEGAPFLQEQGGPSTTGYTGALTKSRATNPTAYSDIAPFLLSDPYPAYTGTLPNTDPTQANLETGNSPGPYIPSGGARVGYVQNYNLGIQMDLGHKMIGELVYVGNSTKRLYAYGTDQLNQLPVSAIAKYGDHLLDPISTYNSANPTNPIPLPYSSFDPDNYNVNQALAPYPQFCGGCINGYDTHAGWSRYDSMQATLTRHVSKGLSTIAAYTWSKTMTNTNSGWTYLLPQDVHQLNLEKAVASYIHVPQMGKLTVIYDLPFGRNRHFVLHGLWDEIAGGWTVSGNAMYQSGDTLSITDSGVNSGIFGGVRPDYTGEPIKLNKPGTINATTGTGGPQYLNPAAFTHVPTACPVNSGECNLVALALGNVPSVLGNIFGPGKAIENASIQKNFGLGDDRYLQFRVDMLNMFNRAGRGDPVTDINNPEFGRIDEVGQDSQLLDSSSYYFQPRVIQFALRLNF